MSLKLTFLGTGTSQGIPVINSLHPVCLSTDQRDKRLRASVLVELEHHTFIIDCGLDFRQQMLTNRCPKLDALLFTHEHSDHTAGLDDIRPFFFNQGPIPIYAHKRVFDSLKQRFDYIFTKENRYPGAPEIIEYNITNTAFCIDGVEILPINGYHYKLQVFGFKIANFAYLTDMKTVADEEIDKIKHIDILVVNALREAPHISHFNLDEALAFIEKVNPKRAYLTHISHLLGFHEVVEKKLPKHVFLAYDNLQITL